jgi:hypothetical protein
MARDCVRGNASRAPFGPDSFIAHLQRVTKRSFEEQQFLRAKLQLWRDIRNPVQYVLSYHFASPIHSQDIP